MNKWEKEVQQSLLDSEEAAIEELEKQYAAALKDITDKVRRFQADIDLLDDALSQDGLDDAAKNRLLSQKRSKVYQKQFQEALKGQVSGILDKMHGDNYSTIEKYLSGCYETGFVGTMYDIARQGIPIITPIDQAAAARAILIDSKLSNRLYTRLSVDIFQLKKTVTQEISRGIASSLSYRDIARNLKNVSGIGLYNAKRITRTEGHRIQQTSARDAQYAAKAKGADVVKQWDAALDGRTRDSHRRVDGEIRELHEKFSNGLMFPGDPNGAAAEVINCRCTSNTRARWALDEAELKILQDRAAYFKLDKTKNFEDFKGKYLQAAKEESKNKYDDTAVNPFVRTSGYRNLYNNLDESTAIQRVACEKAREMLSHRSGTKYEDLTFIDSLTGKSLTRSDYNVENEVLPSLKMRRMVMNAEPHTIIAIHNHPGSSVPSFTDMNTAFEKKYKYGLIACHNGTLMRYTVTGEINPIIIASLLDTAQNSIYNDDAVELKEILSRLKEENVLLEVFR